MAGPDEPHGISLSSYGSPPVDIHSLFGRSALQFKTATESNQSSNSGTETVIRDAIDGTLQHNGALDSKAQHAVNRLFQVEEYRYAAIGSKILPGTKRRLLPHQLTRLYQLVQGIKHKRGPPGYCLPQHNSSGVREEDIILPFCALIRCGQQMLLHTRSDPKSHLTNPKPGEECR